MTAALTKPRPGSSIDKALRALESEGAPMSRAAIAALIEHDEDEVDGLLRYGVRMGLLVRLEADGAVSYRLGDGAPLAEEEPPAPPPVRPVVQPRLVAVPPPSFGANRPTITDTDRRQLSTQWPGGFTTKGGGQAEKLLEVLSARAPAGGDFWLLSRDLADAANVPRSSVQALLMRAITAGCVRAKIVGGRSLYQMGSGEVVREREAEPAPAAPAAPAPAPQPAQPAPASATTDPISPAAADQLVHAATELLGHLDVEIGRLEHNLRILRRRREAFVAMVAAQRVTVA